MSAVHRVYVGGLPPSSSAEELSALINKIVPVSSIYFPDVSVTGLHRGFAIVSIAGTSEQLSKCIRTFNACRWKGARLRFETAKQYYIDRLDEEREEQISMESVEVTEVEPMKEVSRGGMLKLKCGKNKYTYVPTFSTTNTIIKFDTDDEFDSDEYEELNGCSDSESESGFESTSAPNVPDDSASICSDTDVDTDTDTDTDTDSNTDLDLNKKSVSDNVPTTDSTSRIEVGVLQNTAIESVGVKPKGGGRRVGFGTISESSSTDVEKKSTVKTTSTTEADSDLIGLADGQPDKDVYDDDEFGNDCDFEEENEANIEDENALCVENWELEDNALEAERLRQRAMVEKLMNMGLSSASEEKIGSIGVGDSCADGTATILKTLPVEKVNKWHVQPNLRFDPTALARPTSIGSESDETTQKRLRFELATSEQALRDEELTRSATTVGKSADHPASGGTISNENFANITELKGIFLGPGGESSTQQPVPEDNLFSEAEKIGIDVRDDTGGSLLFNFFDQGSETAAPSSSLPMATTITTNDNATSDNAELPDDTTIDVLPVQQVTALPISLPNLSTVFSKAFSFHRDMDVQEINEVWKNTKEKLVVDYKRKSKEARKRKRSSLASFSDTTSGSKSHYTGNSRKKVDTKIRNKKIRAKKA